MHVTCTNLYSSQPTNQRSGAGLAPRLMGGGVSIHRHEDGGVEDGGGASPAALAAAKKGLRLCHRKLAMAKRSKDEEHISAALSALDEAEKALVSAEMQRGTVRPLPCSLGEWTLSAAPGQGLLFNHRLSRFMLWLPRQSPIVCFQSPLIRRGRPAEVMPAGQHRTSGLKYDFSTNVSRDMSDIERALALDRGELVADGVFASLSHKPLELGFGSGHDTPVGTFKWGDWRLTINEYGPRKWVEVAHLDERGLVTLHEDGWASLLDSTGLHFPRPLPLLKQPEHDLVTGGEEDWAVTDVNDDDVGDEDNDGDEYGEYYSGSDEDEHENAVPAVVEPAALSLWSHEWRIAYYSPPALPSDPQTHAKTPQPPPPFLLLCHSGGDQIALPFSAAPIESPGTNFYYRSTGGFGGLHNAAAEALQDGTPPELAITAAGDVSLCASGEMVPAAVFNAYLETPLAVMFEVGSHPKARYEQAEKRSPPAAKLSSPRSSSPRSCRRSPSPPPPASARPTPMPSRFMSEEEEEAELLQAEAASGRRGEVGVRLREGYFSWGEQADWLIDTHSRADRLVISSRRHTGKFRLHLPIGGGFSFVDQDGKERNQRALRALGAALVAAADRHTSMMALGGDLDTPHRRTATTEYGDEQPRRRDLKPFLNASVHSTNLSIWQSGQHGISRQQTHR